MKTTEEAEVSRLRERTAVDGFVKRRGEDEGEVEGGEEEREGVGHWKRRWAKGGEGEVKEGLSLRRTSWGLGMHARFEERERER